MTGISDIYADGITSSDSILSAMGKLSNLIKTWKGYNPNSFAVETDSYKYAKLKSGIINLPNVSVTSNGYLFVQDAVIKYNDQAFPLNDRNVIRMPAMPPTGLKRIIVVRSDGSNAVDITYQEPSANPVDTFIEFNNIMRLATIVQDGTTQTNTITLGQLADIEKSDVAPIPFTYVKRDQNGNVLGSGVVVSAPNGNKWRLAVSNDGQIISQLY